MLDWPANSPDLNPIENVWGIVKKTMRAMLEFCDAGELKAAIDATWASIAPQHDQRLIDSMPLHIDAVIHAKGAMLPLIHATKLYTLDHRCNSMHGFCHGCIGFCNAWFFGVFVSEMPSMK